ncbi:hypothetical protein TUBRATIS_28740, partial [Tubulinosema ratisbonensis]
MHKQMTISFYELKDEITITLYTSKETKINLLTNKTLILQNNFLKKEINLFKEVIEIKEIINYFNKIEIKLKKKEEEYWRCISVPQKYKEKEYLFDEYEKEDLKIDSLEKMMYCLYENGSKEMRRRMDQSFYESEGKELIASVK